MTNEECDRSRRNEFKKEVRDYTDLIAYQKAYELVLHVYKLSEVFPKEEIYGLTSQIRRAAISIPSNIAEGFMRGSKEYTQFLKIALGSAAELETQLSLSKDWDIVGQTISRNCMPLHEKCFVC